MFAVSFASRFYLLTCLGFLTKPVNDTKKLRKERLVSNASYERESFLLGRLNNAYSTPELTVMWSGWTSLTIVSEGTRTGQQ